MVRLSPWIYIHVLILILAFPFPYVFGFAEPPAIRPPFERKRRKLTLLKDTHAAFLGGVLTTITARSIWSFIPPYARQQVLLNISSPAAVRRLVLSEDPEDDFVTVPAITRKMLIIYRKIRSRIDGSKLDDSGSGDFAWSDLIALVKVLNQIRPVRALDRDRRYTECPTQTQVKNPRDVLEGMDELLELAILAYESDIAVLRDEISTFGYDLLRFDGHLEMPGAVGHYIALNREQKKIVIGIKGSTSFSDLLTDCCMQARTYQLAGPFVEGGADTIRVHEGISLAVRRLANDLETMMAELFIPSDYSIVITGHSLGGAVASLLAMVVRSRLGSRYPELLRDQGSMLQVVAFASPPVLDHDTALACASFTTTIINNSDVIPRTSLANLSVLLEYLKTVNRKLEERGMSPGKSIDGTLRYIAMLLKQEMSHDGKEGDPILTIEEIRKSMQDAYDKVELTDPDHLYVPGRVIHMYDLWSKEGYGEAKTINKRWMHPNRTDKDEKDDTILDPNGLNPVDFVRAAEGVHIADGTSKVLRYIEIDERMVADHLVPAYRDSIRSLLENDPAESGTRALTQKSVDGFG